MNVVTSLLVLLSIGVGLVESVGNFQIVTFFENVPEELQDEMINKTHVTISFLQQFLMDCDWVDPGESQPSDGLRRQLSNVAADGSAEGVAAEIDYRRDLPAVIDCPNKCSKSRTAYCRSLGCAMCGKCRRERKLTLVTAKYVGNNWMPRSAFPLGNCQADCDSNADCQPGMICYQRTIGSPLPPGCTGRSVNNEDDYCVWAPTKAPTRFPSRMPTKLPTKSPTETPVKSPTRTPSAPPTPSPTAKATKAPTKIPTTAPTDSPVTTTRAPTDSPSTSTRAPSSEPSGGPSKAPTRRPTRYPTVEVTKAPTSAPQTATPTSAPQTAAPTSAPQTAKPSAPQTAAPTSAPSKLPTLLPTIAPSTDDQDLLAQDVDEDFETFLSQTGVSAQTIEDRLDRHANFFYCTLQGLVNCTIRHKIMQMLNNGTVFPVTGWPELP